MGVSCKTTFSTANCYFGCVFVFPRSLYHYGYSFVVIPRLARNYCFSLRKVILQETPSCQRSRIQFYLPEKGMRAISGETVRLKPYNMLFIRSNRFFAAYTFSFRLKSSSCWRQYIKINIACQALLTHFCHTMSKT